MFRCAASDLERGVRSNLINSTPSKRIGHKLFSPFYVQRIHAVYIQPPWESNEVYSKLFAYPCNSVITAIRCNPVVLTSATWHFFHLRKYVDPEDRTLPSLLAGHEHFKLVVEIPPADQEFISRQTSTFEDACRTESNHWIYVLVGFAIFTMCYYVLFGFSFRWVY